MRRPDLLVLDEPTAGLDPLVAHEFRRCIDEARDRGQTVFLSSHVLSEVEALCDRVGVLREGRLIEMGTLAEMRHLSAVTVEATFEGTVPDLAGVEGVRSVTTTGHTARAQVSGSMGPCSECWRRRASGSSAAASPPSRSCSSPSTATSTTGRGWPTAEWRRRPDRRPGRPDRPSGPVPAVRALARYRRVPPYRGPECPLGALWGLVFGIYVAATASSYSTIYRTPADRRALARAFGTNRTTIALFGPAPQLQTVHGFAVLKASLTLTVIGAIWGLLISTRLLAGRGGRRAVGAPGLRGHHPGPGHRPGVRRAGGRRRRPVGHDGTGSGGDRAVVQDRHRPRRRAVLRLWP